MKEVIEKLEAMLERKTELKLRLLTFKNSTQLEEPIAENVQAQLDLVDKDIADLESILDQART